MLNLQYSTQAFILLSLSTMELGGIGIKLTRLLNDPDQGSAVSSF